MPSPVDVVSFTMRAKQLATPGKGVRDKSGLNARAVEQLGRERKKLVFFRRVPNGDSASAADDALLSYVTTSHLMTRDKKLQSGR
jgi:hypothetical protein